MFECDYKKDLSVQLVVYSLQIAKYFFGEEVLHHLECIMTMCRNIIPIFNIMLDRVSYSRCIARFYQNAIFPRLNDFRYSAYRCRNYWMTI